MAKPCREVLRGPLLHRKKGRKHWKRKTVVVFCGGEINGEMYSAYMALYKHYEDMEKASEKKPKKLIYLFGARVDEHTYSLVESQEVLGKSTRAPLEKPHQFAVVHSNGVNEFKAEPGVRKNLWPRLLKFLTMFPHSVIPEEPPSNPITERFRHRLSLNSYGADSAWAVYVMPEEVGWRCNAIGLHLLLLRGEPGMCQVQVICPVDAWKPIVTWTCDKVGLLGKVGNLVHLMITGEGQGGPGFFWMYAGFGEVYSLQDTLHRFLFPRLYINVQSSIMPQLSVDKRLPSSGKCSQSPTHTHSYRSKEGSIGGVRAGSGFPVELPVSQTQDVPPPIRLDKHPLFQKRWSALGYAHHGSACSASTHSSFGAPPQPYVYPTVSLADDEPLTSPQSVSPEDEANNKSGTGQLGVDQAVASEEPHYEMDPNYKKDSHCEMDPNYETVKSRVVAHDQYKYETMRHPGLSSQFQEDHMKTTRLTASRPSHYDSLSTFRKTHYMIVSSHSQSANYENVVPAVEGAPKSKERPDEYESD